MNVIQWEMASTREQYGNTLVELGHENSNIVVLGGDLNVSTFTHLFGKVFPERFFDFGAAEQNMISAAAGFAAAGKIPFCSTFAVFGTGRAFDQIRLGVAQSFLNVKLVCTHAGLLTGEDGISAQSIEDLGLMLSLPTMTVITPSDAEETAIAVRAAADLKGPVYIRLCRPATPMVHQGSCGFELGKAEALKDGADVGILACGTMVSTALEAAALLSKEDISAAVLNIHTLRPLDDEAISRVARATGAIVTAEEHYVHGALGSLVSSVVGGSFPVPIETVGVKQYAESGKAAQLLAKYGLTASHIADAARRAIARK